MCLYFVIFLDFQDVLIFSIEIYKWSFERSVKVLKHFFYENSGNDTIISYFLAAVQNFDFKNV